MAYGKAHSGIDKRVVRTKKAIRSALFEILETKDISSVTVSELARKAGVNRRTFYTHYTGITDIIDEVEEELVGALRDIALNFHDDNLHECVHDVFLKLDTIVSEDFDYCFRRLKLDLQGAFVGRIGEIIDEFAQKVVRSTSSRLTFETSRNVAAFAVGGFITLFFEWKNGKVKSLEEASDIVSTAIEESIKRVLEKNAE